MAIDGTCLDVHKSMNNRQAELPKLYLVAELTHQVVVPHKSLICSFHEAHLKKIRRCVVQFLQSVAQIVSSGVVEVWCAQHSLDHGSVLLVVLVLILCKMQ